MLLACRERIDQEEWIDRPDVSPEHIRATIRDQALVNRWLGGADATWRHAFPFLRRCGSNPVRVVDLACGGGDISRGLVDEARRLGKRVEVIGLDMGSHTIARARELSRGYPEIAYVRGDALHPPFAPGAFDIVIGATFIHHLPPENVVSLLNTASVISRGWVVAADLVRSSVAHWAIRVFARLAGFDSISAHDGAVSVCRAYSPEELAELARRAGLRNWRLHRHRFYRMTLVYEGDAESSSA